MSKAFSVIVSSSQDPRSAGFLDKNPRELLLFGVHLYRKCSNFFRMPLLAVAIAVLTGPQIALAQAAAAPAAGDAQPFVQSDLSLTYNPPAGFKAEDVG